MKLKTEVIYNPELSEEFREKNYIRYDDTTHTLFVFHKGRIIRQESDDMEPEDATFVRDLSWVADAINEAYTLGFTDGAGESVEIIQYIPSTDRGSSRTCHLCERPLMESKVVYQMERPTETPHTIHVCEKCISKVI